MAARQTSGPPAELKKRTSLSLSLSLSLTHTHTHTATHTTLSLVSLYHTHTHTHTATDCDTHARDAQTPARTHRLTRRGTQPTRQTPSTGLRHRLSPSTSAVFSSYAIESRKLSANEQFLVGAQTVVSLISYKQLK